MLRPGILSFALAACLYAHQVSAQGGPPLSARGAGSGAPADRGDRSDEGVEEPGEMVSWRGTALKWSQGVTTTALGVGGDYQSGSDQVYSHGYWALLNYFLVDEENWSMRVASSPGFDVEWTNSNTTTTEHEPLLRDLNLTSVATWNVWKNDREDVFATLIPNATVFLPTSKVSRGTGTHFVTSPRLTVALTTPFIKGTDFFDTVSFLASGRWDHQFTEATVPTNASVAVATRSRTHLTFTPYLADQLSGVAFAHDSVSVGAGVWFQGARIAEGPLDLAITTQWSKDYLYDFSDAEVAQGGAQAGVDRLSDRQTTRTRTNFSATLSYYPMPEWGFSLGYTNSNSDLAPDGQRRSIFYSPDAAFTTLFILSIDAIYEAMVGPRRPMNFTLPG